MPFLDFHLSANPREALEPGELQGAGGWMCSCLGCEMWITQHRLEPSATGFQLESLLALVHKRVGCCIFLALDRTVLTRGAGRKTGSYSLWSSWSWREGGENVPTRSPSNRAALAGWEAAGMLARITVSTVILLALQNQGVFPSPSPLFLLPLHHLVLPWGE